MEEFNQRQLNHMYHQIQAYEASKLDLGGLISSLESLLGCLKDMPDHWINDFREQWGVLEEVYSVAIVRQQELQSPDNRRQVASALERVKDLVRDALAGAE